MLKVTTD